MKIIISPSMKFTLMIGMVFVFLVTIHYGVLPNLHHLANLEIPAAVRIFLVVITFVIAFAVLIYTNAFRPMIPGKSSWGQEKYWCPLTIEKSPAGVGKLICLVIKIFIFSMVLYAVLSYTIHLYVENIPAIMKGAYVHEYDKMETVFMGAPLVMAFLLLLYVSLKLYDYIRLLKKKM